MQPFRITATFQMPDMPPPGFMQAVNQQVQAALASLGALDIKTSFEDATCIRQNDTLRYQQQSAWQRERSALGVDVHALPLPKSCKACRAEGLERVCKSKHGQCPNYKAP